MALRILGIALVAALSASPALAKDGTGYRMIAAGNLGAAEQTLVAERRIYPQRPELMLNLAAVYERTGRATEARALYREVLSNDPVPMEMPSGDTASSHVVAMAGLRMVDGGQIVSR